MTLNRKIAVLLIALFLGLTMPQGVFAGDWQARAEVRGEFREERKDFLRGLKERTGSFVQSIVNAGKAVIIGGEITAKTDTTITVEKDGVSYIVNITDHTQLRRRFWGKSTTDEFSIGNTVNVYGAWTDDTHTAINARMIRNLSIQMRFGVFFGQVKSLLPTGWVMSTISAKRPDQTVTVNAETKFENRRGETILQTDIQVGHRVRVKGLWDNSNNTITEVRQVKDFSLPVVNTTVTPTPTPTP